MLCNIIHLALSDPHCLLQSLDISSFHSSDHQNRLGDTGAIVLSSYLRTSTQLRELRIAGVGGVGFYQLCKEGFARIHEQNKLQILDVRGNWMSDKAFIKV